MKKCVYQLSITLRYRNCLCCRGCYSIFVIFDFDEIYLIRGVGCCPTPVRRLCLLLLMINQWTNLVLLSLHCALLAHRSRITSLLSTLLFFLYWCLTPPHCCLSSQRGGSNYCCCCLILQHLSCWLGILLLLLIHSRKQLHLVWLWVHELITRSLARLRLNLLRK